MPKIVHSPSCKLCGRSSFNIIFYQIEPTDCVYIDQWTIPDIIPGDYLCHSCLHKREKLWIRTNTLPELLKGVGYQWCDQELEDLFKERLSRQ